MAIRQIRSSRRGTLAARRAPASKSHRRARSQAEFVSKIGIVVEEADETVYWLECLIESGIVKEDLLKELLTEANELVAIFAASHRTSRR